MWEEVWPAWSLVQAPTGSHLSRLQQAQWLTAKCEFLLTVSMPRAVWAAAAQGGVGQEWRCQCTTPLHNLCGMQPPPSPIHLTSPGTTLTLCVAGAQEV